MDSVITEPTEIEHEPDNEITKCENSTAEIQNLAESLADMVNLTDVVNLTICDSKEETE